MGSVSKTFNCKHCDMPYWVMTAVELIAHNALPNPEKVAFETKVLNDHIEVCFNKGLYSQVPNALRTS